MKRLWKNATRKTKIISMLVVFVVVFGACYGYHVYTAHADQYVTRGVINDIATLPKNISADRGTQEHPFLFLEIVPSVDKASIGYMINGCEPIEFDESSPAQVREKYSDVGFYVSKVFDDEYEHYFGTAEERDKVFPGTWQHTDSSTSIDMYGYYEKVGANEGNFKYTENYLDGDVYRPKFTEVEFGTGDYIWVSCVEKSGINEWQQGDFNTIAKRDNKVSKEAGTLISYQEGDREYTERTGTTHCYGDMDHIHGVHRNDFLRTAIGASGGCYTRKEIRDYNVLVKTIEPKELSEHPEWVDYADLIFMSRSGSSYADRWSKYKHKIWKTGTAPTENFGQNGQDFTWEVAKKLFMKVNGFEEYDGSVYNFAPLLLDYNVVKNSYFNNAPDAKTYYLDYRTMTSDTTIQVADTGGCDSNIWKFLVMDLSMKQEQFYRLFFEGKRADGTTVIQEKDGEGVCSAQENEAAKTHWNYHTFFPNDYGSFAKSEKEKEETRALYGLYPSFELGAGTDNANLGLNGFTFMFNADNLMTQLSTTGSVNKNPATQDAFDWWAEEGNDMGNSMNPQDLLHYLLQYRRDRGGDDGRRYRDKKKIRVLEIEPCNSFTLSELYLMYYLAPSKYSGGIEIDYMTTQEFNGSKKDLSGEYDFVYIGMNTDKFNLSDPQYVTYDYLINQWGGMTTGNQKFVRYNDGKNGNWNGNSDDKLWGKTYLHVGDQIEAAKGSPYRLSGDDITSIKWKQLRNYALAGHPVVVDECLYAIDSPLHHRTVDSTSNIERLVTNKEIRKLDNFVKLTELEQALDMAAIEGADVSITGWPAEYSDRDITSLTDEGSEEVSVKAKQKLNGTTLDFAFEIGYSEEGENYAVKLLVDTNYDGVLTESGEANEVVYNSYDAETGSGTTYSCGKMEEDETGKLVEVPAKYTLSYDIKDIPNGRRNGAIAWKIVIYSLDKEEYYYQKSGTSWYGAATDDKGNAPGKYNINVLQVVADDDQAGKMNLESQNELFTQYAENLDDYEITVTTKSLKEYIRDFQTVNSGEYNATLRESFTGAGSSYYYPKAYEDYNVLLISCGMELQNADNSCGAAAYPVYLAAQGSSVLYTMDAVEDSEKASSQLTGGIKEALNQSRFTDTSYADIASYSTGQSSGAEKKYYDLGDYGSLEYTYYKAMQKGNSSNSLMAYSNELWKKIGEEQKMEFGVGEQKAKKATLVNVGTITTYPYMIDDTISIAGTQAQTFQLNLEKPYANVWYCLGGPDNTTYGISPNDAVNNYYLYSSENVTYSGIDLKNTESDMEMKLFINALIGTYEAAYPVPYVTIDKVRNVDKGEDESLSLSINEAQERHYKVDVPTSTQDVDITQFKEYVPGSQILPKKTLAPPTPSPTPTATPKPSAPPATINPDVEETAAPEPVGTPEADDILLQYENTAGSNGVSFQTGSQYGTSWLEDASDDAVIVIKYTCTDASVSPSTRLFQWRGAKNDWNNVGPAYEACQEGSSDPTEIQTAKTTYGELKQAFTSPVDPGASAVYLYLESLDWRSKLLSVTVYKDSAAALRGEQNHGGTGDGSGGDPSGPSSDKDKDNELKPSKFEDVTGENIMDQEDVHYTHKIFFTPYDAYLHNGPIQSLRISMVNDVGEEQESLGNIKYVYRQYKDSKGTLHIERYEMSEAGYFDIPSGNYLTDNVQYFVLYSSALAGGDYHYLRFDIANRKKYGVTYLDIQETVEQVDRASDVYVFPLD